MSRGEIRGLPRFSTGSGRTDRFALPGRDARLRCPAPLPGLPGASAGRPPAPVGNSSAPTRFHEFAKVQNYL